jgi:hypothetical protein
VHSSADSRRKECVYVPAGTVISVLGDMTKDSHFVEVLWDSRKVFMFPQDIQDRAFLIHS